MKKLGILRYLNKAYVFRLLSFLFQNLYRRASRGGTARLHTLYWIGSVAQPHDALGNEFILTSICKVQTESCT